MRLLRGGGKKRFLRAWNGFVEYKCFNFRERIIIIIFFSPGTLFFFSFMRGIVRPCTRTAASFSNAYFEKYKKKQQDRHGNLVLIVRSFDVENPTRTHAIKKPFTIRFFFLLFYYKFISIVVYRVKSRRVP